MEAKWRDFHYSIAILGVADLALTSLKDLVCPKLPH
jgi:hypothetical protein